MYEKKNHKNTDFWNALTLFEMPVVLKLCFNSLDLRGLFLQYFEPIQSATIPLKSSQRRSSKPSNFTIVLVFLTLNMPKDQVFKKKTSGLQLSFSGPKNSRDFRDTGPRAPNTFETTLVLIYPCQILIIACLFDFFPPKLVSHFDHQTLKCR